MIECVTPVALRLSGAVCTYMPRSNSVPLNGFSSYNGSVAFGPAVETTLRVCEMRLSPTWMHSGYLHVTRVPRDCVLTLTG